jgi:hypothetical protein
MIIFAIQSYYVHQMKESYIKVSKRCDKWNWVLLIVAMMSLIIATFGREFIYSGQNVLLLLLHSVVPYLFIFFILFTLSELGMVYNLFRNMAKEHRWIRGILVAWMVLGTASLAIGYLFNMLSPYRAIPLVIRSLLTIDMIALSICLWVQFAGRLRAFGIYVLATLLYSFSGGWVFYICDIDNYTLYNVLFAVVPTLLQLILFVLLKFTMEAKTEE